MVAVHLQHSELGGLSDEQKAAIEEWYAGAAHEPADCPVCHAKWIPTMWHDNTCDHVPTDGGCHVGGSAHEPKVRRHHPDCAAWSGVIAACTCGLSANRPVEPFDCKNHIAADCPTCKEIWRQHAQNWPVESRVATAWVDAENVVHCSCGFEQKVSGHFNAMNVALKHRCHENRGADNV
jgi:hypothetical protein